MQRIAVGSWAVSRCRPDVLHGGAIFAVCFAAYWACSQRQVADSRYALVISDGLVRYGDFRLDRYFDRSSPPPWEQSYHVHQARGHFYYFFPYGTSVLSAPFVWIANALSGERFETPVGEYNWRYETRVQMLLAAGLMAALAAGLFLLARTCLSGGWASAMALSAAFSTQMLSTASRALWSHTWGIFLLGLAVVVLFVGEQRAARRRPVLLATLLAWSYFTRPTFAVFLAAIGLFLLLRNRRAGAVYSLTGAAWGAAFSAWSWSMFGTALPPYYQGHVMQYGRFAEALAGHLVSPGRGLLVYVPVSLLVVYIAARYARHSRYAGVAVLAAACIGGHWLVTCGNDSWWGGHCYGPRLLTDALPWWFLLAVCAVEGRQSSPPSRAVVRIEAWAAVLLVAAGTAVNLIGACCPDALSWNVTPTNIDLDPGRVWDWRDPPFLRPFRDGADSPREISHAKAGIPLWVNGCKADARSSAVRPRLGLKDRGDVQQGLASPSKTGRCSAMEVFLADTGDVNAAPIRVTKRCFVVGRGDDCDLTLPSRLVSRHHAEIRQRGDDVYVRDLGSRNGTTINGAPVEVERPVQYGDVVAFATEAYVVRMAASDGRLRARRDPDRHALQ